MTDEKTKAEQRAQDVEAARRALSKEWPDAIADVADLIAAARRNPEQAWDEGANAAREWIAAGGWLATMPDNPYRADAIARGDQPTGCSDAECTVTGHHAPHARGDQPSCTLCGSATPHSHDAEREALLSTFAGQAMRADQMQTMTAGELAEAGLLDPNQPVPPRGDQPQGEAKRDGQLLALDDWNTAVPCPHCGSPAGAWCVWLDGQPGGGSLSDKVHLSRAQAVTPKPWLQ